MLVRRGGATTTKASPDPSAVLGRAVPVIAIDYPYQGSVLGSED